MESKFKKNLDKLVFGMHFVIIKIVEGYECVYMIILKFCVLFLKL